MQVKFWKFGRRICTKCFLLTQYALSIEFKVPILLSSLWRFFSSRVITIFMHTTISISLYIPDRKKKSSDEYWYLCCGWRKTEYCNAWMGRLITDHHVREEKKNFYWKTKQQQNWSICTSTLMALSAPLKT